MTVCEDVAGGMEALQQWGDESHVDTPRSGAAAYDIAAQARAAWEAAVCWDPSGTDQFAVKWLAEVQAI